MNLLIKTLAVVNLTRLSTDYFNLSCNCPMATNCDPVSGSCLCPPGKQGPMCLESCDEGFFGSDCSQPCQCKSPHTCHPVTGSCACDRGWTGANCTEPCPAGTYGMKCASKCSCDPDVTVLSRPCDHVTGQCNCKSRYYGVRYECHIVLDIVNKKENSIKSKNQALTITLSPYYFRITGVDICAKYSQLNKNSLNVISHVDSFRN